MFRTCINLLYIDPGTGSMLISALIATLSVVFFTFKDVIYRFFSKKGDRGIQLDPNKHYNLVYYSEGKQYWNVFKPLLEEGSERSIEAVYLTSDKDDPGLDANIEGVQAIYIGTGREAYFNLNRLNADMVIMTTPGLDVLEIKRSKNVKHYSHITHATSSSGSYKSYATDYFDSVLVGGEGELYLIRELEEKRNLPKKDIEIIGHTYLDILRDKLDIEEYKYDFFEEKRKTVLVSPTWGNHGLLTKFGDELLKSLEESDKYNVIIRPHPQSFISEKDLMDDLMYKYPDSPNRVWNTDRENLKAMHHADIMISDFSGIIFDFYTLFKRPILIMSSQFEKRGREASDLKDEPWDLKLLDKIGKRLEEDDLNNITSIIDETIFKYSFGEEQASDINRIVDKYPGESSKRGMDHIESTLSELKEEAHEEDLLLDEDNLNYLNDDYTFNSLLGENKNWFIKVFRSLTSPNFLFQAVVAGFLLLAYSYIGMRFLPKPGLNVEYLTSIKKYFILLTIVIGSVFFISLGIYNKGKFRYFKTIETLDFKNLLFILLPLTPVIQYIFANQDILKFSDSIIVFAIFATLFSVLIIVIPWLLSSVISSVFTVPITVSLLFIVTNMASFGRTTGYLKITLIMLAFIFVSFLLLFFNKKRILLILTSIFFTINSFSSIYQFMGNNVIIKNEVAESKVFKYTEGKEIKNKPDVFLMIYDAYSNQETLDSYGYDNSEQMNFLLDNGFAIYDGTYSIGYGSLISMSHLLNVEPIISDESEYRRMIAGDASGLIFLKNQGYRNHLIVTSKYYFEGYKPQYDTVFPLADDSIATYKIISKSILEGEFRFDVEFSKIVYDDLLNRKELILSQNINEPEFLYHHINDPGHSQNSGVLRPNETDLHIERLERANIEMRKDIYDMNLDNREAIVIIAGDHGPYLTKNGVGLIRDYDLSEVNKLDIQDRFGAFLAIYWPDQSYATRYNIKTIQDVLPAVISYMYEDDSLFDKVKCSNKVETSPIISGAGIDNGIIEGGIDSGKSLFERTGIRINPKN